MYRSWRYTNLVIIHCSDTPNGDDRWDITHIDEWHKARKFHRDSEHLGNPGASVHKHCGYHYVITVAGEIQIGRELVEVGAHTKAYNGLSVGICLVGTDAYTKEQWASLFKLVKWLRTWMRGPETLQITGHRDYNSSKTCPGFDVRTWDCDASPVEARHTCVSL